MSGALVEAESLRSLLQAKIDAVRGLIDVMTGAGAREGLAVALAAETAYAQALALIPDEQEQEQEQEDGGGGGGGGAEEEELPPPPPPRVRARRTAAPDEEQARPDDLLTRARELWVQADPELTAAQIASKLTGEFGIPITSGKVYAWRANHKWPARIPFGGIRPHLPPPPDAPPPEPPPPPPSPTVTEEKARTMARDLLRFGVMGRPVTPEQVARMTKLPLDVVTAIDREAPPELKDA